MINNFSLICILSMICICFISCKSSDDDGTYVPVSPVNFDIENVPYQNLSEYNFFEDGMSDQTPVYGVIPYEPISQLFTDYAKKKRFVWMPNDVKATYVSDRDVLNFPLGTVLIKTFYYNNVQPGNTTKIIETRLMIRKNTGWEFANYVWNDEQTEAILDNNGSFVALEWNEGGQTLNTNYRIPSEAECLTCHKNSNIAISIGTKPQNLNKSYNFSDGAMNQLDKLVDFGYLEEFDTSGINTVLNWADDSQPIDMRARSYLDINCAHCHTENGHCSYRAIRLAFTDSTDDDNAGICAIPDEDIGASYTHIVSPGRSERSVMAARLMSLDESIQMPLIGRTILHDEGIQLISDWIDQLPQVCN
ncbi:MAG: hypothetical protein HRT68_01105 [Flavobacteriaceae bacterium]|nr:hypothetical protein [Flavobacteriaceae bacterium]